MPLPSFEQQYSLHLSAILLSVHNHLHHCQHCYHWEHPEQNFTNINYGYPMQHNMFTRIMIFKIQSELVA